jgi:hypothetical protein
VDFAMSQLEFSSKMDFARIYPAFNAKISKVNSEMPTLQEVTRI